MKALSHTYNPDLCCHCVDVTEVRGHTTLYIYLHIYYEYDKYMIYMYITNLLFKYKCLSLFLVQCVFWLT